MNKRSKPISFNIDILQAVIIILALVVGFVGGIVFSNYVNKPSTPSSPTILPSHICSCPDMPVGQPVDSCRC